MDAISGPNLRSSQATARNTQGHAKGESSYPVSKPARLRDFISRALAAGELLAKPTMQPVYLRLRVIRRTAPAAAVRFGLKVRSIFAPRRASVL